MIFSNINEIERATLSFIDVKERRPLSECVSFIMERFDDVARLTELEEWEFVDRNGMKFARTGLPGYAFVKIMPHRCQLVDILRFDFRIGRRGGISTGGYLVRADELSKHTTSGTYFEIQSSICDYFKFAFGNLFRNDKLIIDSIKVPQEEKS